MGRHPHPWWAWAYGQPGRRGHAPRAGHV